MEDCDLSPAPDHSVSRRFRFSGRISDVFQSLSTNENTLLSDQPLIGLGASPSTITSNSGTNYNGHDVTCHRSSRLRKKNDPLIGVATSPPISAARIGREHRLNTFCCADRGSLAFALRPTTNSRLVWFSFPASGALDGCDHHNSDRSSFEFTSKAYPWAFLFATHNNPNPSSHQEGSTYTTAPTKPLKRGERSVFSYGCNLCGWYGSTDFHYQHDNRETEQPVSGMEIDDTPDYISYPPPQNCHVYPRRLDPTSGVLHNFCSRACAKANSALKCEVLFSAMVNDQTVIWLTRFPLLSP